MTLASCLSVTNLDEYFLTSSGSLRCESEGRCQAEERVGVEEKHYLSITGYAHD